MASSNSCTPHKNTKKRQNNTTSQLCERNKTRKSPSFRAVRKSFNSDEAQINCRLRSHMDQSNTASSKAADLAARMFAESSENVLAQMTDVGRKGLAITQAECTEFILRQNNEAFEMLQDQLNKSQKRNAELEERCSLLTEQRTMTITNLKDIFISSKSTFPSPADFDAQPLNEKLVILKKAVTFMSSKLQTFSEATLASATNVKNCDHIIKSTTAVYKQDIDNICSTGISLEH